MCQLNARMGRLQLFNYYPLLLNIVGVRYGTVRYGTGTTTTTTTTQGRKHLNFFFEHNISHMSVANGDKPSVTPSQAPPPSLQIKPLPMFMSYVAPARGDIGILLNLRVRYLACARVSLICPDTSEYPR